MDSYAGTTTEKISVVKSIASRTDEKKCSGGRAFIRTFFSRYAERLVENYDRPLPIPIYDNYLVYEDSDIGDMANILIRMLPLSTRWLAETADHSNLFSAPLVYGEGALFARINLRSLIEFYDRVTQNKVSVSELQTSRPQELVTVAPMLFRTPDLDIGYLARLANVSREQWSAIGKFYCMQKIGSPIRTHIESLCPISIITFSDEFREEINDELVRISETLPIAHFLTAHGVKSPKAISMLELPEMALSYLNKKCPPGRHRKKNLLTNNYLHQVASALNLCVVNCIDVPVMILTSTLHYLREQITQPGQLDARTVDFACQHIAGNDTYHPDVCQAARMINAIMADE